MDNYFITNNGDKWKLTKQGNDRASLTADTKKEIMQQTRIYMENKVGSVKIQKLNGQFQEERTYHRANDPNKTKG